MSVPNQYEFRLSPDRRQFAIWEPGNEPWFVPEAAMQGRWIKPNDMDRLGWTRYVPVDDTPPAAVEPSDQPRLFHLQRDHDVSGVSGTGRVANGVLWPDGTVSLRWIGERPSTVHWDRLEDAEHVHGHGGATRIVWADEQQGVTEPVCVCGHPTQLHHEDVCLLAECGCADNLDVTALPEALEAALTKRFTELGNQFAEMRVHEQGPDGWPSSRLVSPRMVTEALQELIRRTTDEPQQP